MKAPDQQASEIQALLKSINTAGQNQVLELSLTLAQMLLNNSQQLQSKAEHRQQIELDRLIQNPEDKYILTQLTDQSFRSHEAQRSADQLIHILDVQGIPRFFSRLDRALMRGFQSFGDWLPSVSMPLVQEKMRKETANVILPGEREDLSQHIRERHEQGIHMNVNMLGEALLGETEAARRLAIYKDLLSWPDIRFISVKISTIFSQIHPFARQHNIDVLGQRLDELYHTALKYNYTNHAGKKVSKFIYLDMEEFRDLELTAQVFMQTLDQAHLQQSRAGIVLQAYIPDSFQVLEQLCDWASKRKQAGAQAIGIRIVKGANMETERVLAAQSNLPLPCFRQKIDTDIQFKRMLHYVLERDDLDSIQLGIASHNLFDIAYAMVLVEQHQAWHRIQFEMLEGMANHQRRAIQQLTKNILLYAPACHQDEFINAIGYLIRRLDENTGPDNFLRYSFNLKAGSDTYKRLEQQFIQSVEGLQKNQVRSFRTQDRRASPNQPRACKHWWTYDNEPDTDFALQHNCDWAIEVLRQSKQQLPLADIPIQIAGQVIHQEQTTAAFTVNQPDALLAQVSLADTKQVAAALNCADKDPTEWSHSSSSERRTLLRSAAQIMRERRADLLAIAIAETGKTLLEADLELNEAIDFLEFYPACVEDIDELDGITTEALGVVCVIPPWNFPLAIPCGGVAAALAAGNRVILKPAPESVACAYALCQVLWDAGIPMTALQFVPCAEDGAASQLITDPRVDLHILTGASSTAELFYRMRPDIHLSAETGGKNSIIVSALSDRDLAIKHIIHSAFGHSGQKCSACSLLILEAEVYDDEAFQEALRDATHSLHVSASWDPACKINPLISKPNKDLAWAIDHLDAGEYWLVEPQIDKDNPQLISPGIKYGVQAHSRSHQTEFFGPVLSVMRAQSLQHAIDLANAVPYGLTAGLQSLDDREQDIWRARIQAGNLYINRPITGAIVLRQPFGGFGASSYGPGLKAGGPNYLMQFLKFSEDPQSQNYDRLEPDPDLHGFLDTFARGLRKHPEITLNHQRLQHAADSYTFWAQKEFLKNHDHVRLLGQDNIRRYLPVDAMRLRLDRLEDLESLLLAILASRSVAARCSVSLDPSLPEFIHELIHDASINWAGALEIVDEDQAALITAIQERQADRLRYFNPASIPEALYLACAQGHCFLDTRPACSHGRRELLSYVREQTISHDYHRYGNLGRRQHEERRPVR